MQSHKHAWPFLKAVNKDAVPDYYTIIKEPMGKCFTFVLICSLANFILFLNRFKPN